jgi:HPt (histidine-containing phosphotransfer) domain-containing protein
MNVAVAPLLSPAGNGTTGAVGGGVLDRHALDKLRELDPAGKGGLVQRVLATYTSSSARLLEQFGAARAREDMRELRHIAHTLKSSSASVGALELSALCADVERRLRDSQSDGLEPQLDAMAREGARVLAAVRAALPA